MLKGYRSTLVGTTSVVALALASTAPAAAQDEQEAQAVVGLESIIVTARRVEENIQRVPIAIQAFTPEKLADQDIKDIWSLTKNIAGLNICCSPGDTSFIFLRGIGNGAPTYFADVPASASALGEITVSLPIGNMFDISSVQVLKGPQGTLFGQASNAGAIIYNPKKPGEVFGGYVEASAGQYGRRSIEGALDIPLLDDKVLFRIAATTYARNGFAVNVVTNKDHGDQNYYIIRPSLTLRITDDLEIYTLYQHDKRWDNTLPFLLEDFNFDPPGKHPIAGTLAFLNLIFEGITNWDAARAKVLADQIALGDYKYNGFSTGCSQTGATDGSCLFSWVRAHFLTNTISYNITDDITIKNIFGWSFGGRSFSEPSDTDGSPLTVFDNGSPRNTKTVSGSPQWSDEIQIIWNNLFDIVDLQAGTFHRAQHNEPMVLYARTLGFDALASASIGKTSNRSRAVYVQANVDLRALVEGLTFTGGIRETWDKSVQQNWSLNATTLAVNSVSGGAGTPTGEGHWSNLSYTAGFQYQYNEDILLFITNARGFGSGGLQNVYTKETFQPDVLTNIEVGTKATFDVGDWIVRANASYFHGWFNDVKVSVTQLARRVATDPDNLIVVTENAAKAIIKGVEADLTVVPTDWLEIGGMYAYTNTNYTVWPSFLADPLGGAPIPISLANTPFSYTPFHKWTVRGTYHLPIDQ